MTFRPLNKEKKVLILISVIAIGMALRALWVIFVNTAPISDFLIFHNSALSIINGEGYKIEGYTSAYEPIGYPAFLSALYFLFTPDIIVPKIANILLSGAIILLTFLIANRIFSYTAGVLAAFLLALSPRNITYTSVLSTEIIFTCLFLLVCFLLLKKPERNFYTVLMGILLGILVLIKPYMLIYQFAVLTMDICIQKNIRYPLKRFFIITIIMVIVISPWSIRNYTVFHKFIPVSTNGGYNLFINNNPYADGGWQDPFMFPGSPLLKYKHANDEFWDEVAVDDLGKELAVKWIVKNPDEFVKVGLKKLYRSFILCDDTSWATGKLVDGTSYKYSSIVYDASNKVYKAARLMAVLFVLLILIEWIRSRKINPYYALIFVNFAFFAAIIFIFEGQPRYIFPLLPWFAIMAGCTIEKLFSRLLTVSSSIKKIIAR